MTCLLLGSAVFFLRTVGFFAVVGPRIEWRITCSKIDEIGAGMYKGEKVTQAARHAITTPE